MLTSVVLLIVVPSLIYWLPVCLLYKKSGFILKQKTFCSFLPELHFVLPRSLDYDGHNEYNLGNIFVRYFIFFEGL